MYFSNFSLDKLKLWQQPFLLSILITLTIGISDNAIAQAFDEYCLSTVGQVELVEKLQKDPTQILPPFIRSVGRLPELYRNRCDAIAHSVDKE